ncbi:MAG: hypothetical protein MUF51_07800 [Vicinamibacteria bacterium]|nr:hypothetical protein [Vicinamibacteria bacterium]
MNAIFTSACLLLVLAERPDSVANRSTEAVVSNPIDHSDTEVAAAPSNVALSALSAAAQTSEPHDNPNVTPIVAPAHQRVRITIGGNRLIGDVIERDSHSLLLNLGRQRPSIRIACASIQSIEISRGRHRNTISGAKTGAVRAGIALGLLGYMLGHAWDPSCYYNRCAVSASIGLAMGAGLGAAAGSLTKTDWWEEAALTDARLRVIPRRDGLSAALAFRF